MPDRLSIRRRLLFRLITAIILCWVVAAWFVYFAAYREVEEIYDAALAQQARVLATLMSHEVIEEGKVKQDLQQLVNEIGMEVVQQSQVLMRVMDEYFGEEGDKDYLTLLSRENLPGHRYESKIAFIVISETGEVILRSHTSVAFSEFSRGFSEREMDEKRWRTFGMIEPESRMQVQVGEQLSVRQKTVKYIVLNSLWPLFLALPIIGFVIWFTVGGGLRPLKQVAQKVEQRDPNSLVPVSLDEIPQEVVPMVESLNILFARVKSALENERRFTADAAHELRTPLAGLKTMAQAKRLSEENSAHRPFLDQICKGVDRTTHLLEQLLTLARMESQTIVQEDFQRVDLADRVIQVLSVIGQQAIFRSIDLTFEGGDRPVYVKGYAPALEILIRNLVDNAIRYTPEAGKVRVLLQPNESKIDLIVEDSGPGIDEELLDEVFQRFRRGAESQAEGSGLGLSIVHRITELHHADISLSNINKNSGLRAVISFPMASDLE
jgi:two-component system sensor histidine kinase QseC